MREIKFRAWMDDEKKMYENVGLAGEIVFFEYETTEDEDFEQQYWGILQGGDALMQYTGLKDKHGKEIYEGDIVRYPNIQAFGDNWKVEFDKGSFTVKEKTARICIRELAFKQNLEVVGNIYENPELLEGAK